jgi:hypothetical protein
VFAGPVEFQVAREDSKGARVLLKDLQADEESSGTDSQPEDDA